MKKVIITGQAHPFLAETLRAKGYAVLDAPAIQPDELEKEIKDAEGLVLTTRVRVNKELLDKAPALQWIGRLGSGMELIDLPAAEARGIRCVSSPEGNCLAVAEHALGLLLSLMNNFPRARDEVRAGIWKRNENRGTELSGKTVGLIGFGHTGSTFASLLKPFGVEILAYDKYKFGFGGDSIHEASMEQVARYAQVVSFHVPLTDETRHMANLAFFQSLQMKPWLLNTSRGPVVSQPDLATALDQELLAGAGLDVLENEDIVHLPDAEKQQVLALAARENVIITPHIAGYSHEAFYKMARVLLQKLALL